MAGKAISFCILTGIFVAGAVSGVLLDNAIGGKKYGWVVLRPQEQPPERPRSRPDFPTRTLSELEKEITLTDAQKAEIEKLARATDEELKALRRESMSAGSERIKAMHARIAPLLNADQQVKFVEYQKKKEEQMRTAQNSGNRPPPPPDGARPPPSAEGGK